MENSSSDRWLKNALILVLLMFILWLVDDNVNGTMISGSFSLVFSALTIREVKQNNNLAILFWIIFYINLSVFVLGSILKGSMFDSYQEFLWNSKYNAIGMKCILVSSCVFYLVMGRKEFKSNKNNDFTDIIKKCRRNRDYLVSYMCFLIIVLLCMYAFNGAVIDGKYVSNQNPLFEYVIFFFAISWCYLGDKSINKIVWLICASFYVATALFAGDRSSAFMLLLLIASYKIKDLGLLKMLTLCFLGITFANFIAFYRNDVGDNLLMNFLPRGSLSFFSDTAAFSYYTGITIYYYLDQVTNHLQIFGGWLLSLFTGSLFVDRKSVELAVLANRYYYNAGGGLFQPYFYLVFGYVGVALGTYIVATILTFVYKSHNRFCLMLQFVIPAMSFRWYLYTPTAFFRSCLINFFIIYLFFWFLHEIRFPNSYR